MTFACGTVAALLPATRERRAPLRIVRGIAWPVVALTATLFVLVEALDAAGAAALASTLASNLVNNLPVDSTSASTSARRTRPPR